LETVYKNRVTDRVTTTDPEAQGDPATGDPVPMLIHMPYTVRYMCSTIYSFADIGTALTGVLSFVAILAVDGESGNLPQVVLQNRTNV